MTPGLFKYLWDNRDKSDEEYPVTITGILEYLQIVGVIYAA